MKEDHPAVPIDINGIHKLAAEYYHLFYDGAYGVRSTVLRLTNTYGPRQRINDDRQGVAAVFLRTGIWERRSIFSPADTSAAISITSRM